MSNKARKSLMEVLRVRHVNPEGKMVKIAEVTPNDRLWPYTYDGRFGHIYFGHRPFPNDWEPKRFEHATGVDLGCAFGGHLAAVILEPGHEPRSVTVKAKRAFAEYYEDD